MDIAALNDLDSVSLNWVIIQSRFCARPFFLCVYQCAWVTVRGSVVFVAVNMLCMISQLNPGIRSARLDAVGWAFDEVYRWSAWRPNNTAPLSSSLAYNCCFCGIDPLRVPPKRQGVGPYSWTWSYSNEDRNALLFPPEMAKNFFFFFLAGACSRLCVCLPLRACVWRERSREEGQGGGSTWQVSACVLVRLIVLVRLLCVNAVQRE